ncbi:hypothetical protein EJV44_20285 [Ancylobacter aquaticus]|nr:hypothetical protein EJV44_20285 [Ancylobacter aquaticus]
MRPNAGHSATAARSYRVDNLELPQQIRTAFYALGERKLPESGDSPDKLRLLRFIGREVFGEVGSRRQLLASRPPTSPKPSLPSKVKSLVVAELKSLYDDLLADRVRVSRPTKFVFLCGGVISKLDNRALPQNLRDYIYRYRPLNIKHPIILAEDALNLFRDSGYRDLITFEEDIARIASVVLVIAESAGSLAELGAFASTEAIRRTLRVIIQEEHERAESFVRHGPIQKLINSNKRESLGVYPWRKAGERIVIRSVNGHYREIKKFICENIDKSPKSKSLTTLKEERKFYIVYWIIHLCHAITVTKLLDYANLIVEISVEDLKKALYCLILAKWIRKYSYDRLDYYLVLHDEDIFEYKFKPNVINRNSVLRKLEVYNAHVKKERLPKHVRDVSTRFREAV